MKQNGSILCALTLMLCVFGRGAFARQQADGPQAEEVVRVNAELVQTGVSVFDKQGRFVDGLKKEDFELRVDGRPVPITFFENVVAGSLKDRLVRAAAAGEPAPAKAVTAATSFRQRTIVFFLDDRHLSLNSVTRARKLLLDFIDKEMGEGDLVAVASASGRIGFLQQFTDNKEVLRAAVARIGHVPYVVTDYGRNPGGTMTEYAALAIERKDDERLFDFYVEDCMRWGGAAPSRDPAVRRQHCEMQVQSRARQILIQSGTVTADTYYSLETLLRYAERMPGSKLAFFVSDGFLADTGPRGPVGRERLARITDEARRAGVVIYTIDARGLVSGEHDAAGTAPMDPNGRLESSNLREVVASQDALNALAGDTGGRALRNQNTFGQFVNDALEETSRYYLIAWRPEANEGKNEKLRTIEVSVAGRPELTVRSARGFVSGTPSASASTGAGANVGEKGAAKVEKKPGDSLSQALTEFYPRQAIPLQLSLIYLDVPSSGTVLTTSVQAFTEGLSYGAQDREPAQLTIEGVVLDDQGKPAASFRARLKVNPPSEGEGARNASDVIYNYPSPLKPGIYQVRVAARDERSGTLGSAAQWFVIPDLSARQLTLSSLIVGLEGVGERGAAGGHVQWSVDKRFARGSHLRFMTFIYNASAPGNLWARVQVSAEGREVSATPFRKIGADAQTDPARVPFTAEINLKDLQPGRYTLQVTVEDRAANRTATQQTAFYVQ